MRYYEYIVIIVMILLYANTHLAGSNSDPLPSHMESIPTNGPVDSTGRAER